MARGTLRGAATAWLGLIALQAITSDNGSQNVSGAMGWLTSAVQRALDPNVPAIPDFSKQQSPASAPAGADAQQMTNPYLAAARAASNPAGIPRPGANVLQ